MKRTPWFNAQKQPPVNGGPDAVYEARCLVYLPDKRVIVRRKADIDGTACPYCQWRGLTRPASKGEK